MPEERALIDGVDRSILRAMHELEFDPCTRGLGATNRISPVPLYFIYAATVPISLDVPLSEYGCRMPANPHARLERLNALGYVRAAETRLFDPSFWQMRDGRFVAVRCVPGEDVVGEDTEHCVKLPHLELKISFDHKSHLDAELTKAHYGEPGTNPCEIMSSVLEEHFQHLSWIHRDEAAIKKAFGVSRAPVEKWGLCYTLTESGIQSALLGSNGADVSPAGTTQRDRLENDPIYAVTMEQAAAISGVSKRTLERYLTDGKLPVPDFPGGGGRSHKWNWARLRPELEKVCHRQLPEKFPASRIL